MGTAVRSAGTDTPGQTPVNSITGRISTRNNGQNTRCTGHSTDDRTGP